MSVTYGDTQFIYTQNNLIDSDNNKYLTVYSLIDIIDGSNNITLTKANVDMISI